MATTVAAGSSATFEVGPYDTITLTDSNAVGTLALTSQTPKIVSDQTLAVQNGTFGPWGAPMSVVMTVTQGSADYTVNSRSLTGSQARDLAAGYGFGGTTITRAALITLAEANSLTPGAFYLTTDGLQCQALTSRFLQPLGPWFVDGRRWSVGSATSATDLTYTYLPPLAPNAQVDIWHQWSMDATNVTKRARIYLDGTLGGGVSGAQAVYTRNFTDATTVMFPSFHRVTNRNDAAAQICQGIGDSAVFGLSTSAPVTLTVSTNTSKLLRAMGETSKSGSNVTITTLTRSGSTAIASVTAHGLTTGDYIGVTGAAQTEYNVDPVAVTVQDANTFTYPVTGTPTTPATGTPVYQKYVSLALVSFRVEVRQGLGF